MNDSAITIGSAHPLISLLIYQQEVLILVVTFGGMLLLLMLETAWPRRLLPQLPVSRWVNNWLLASFNFVVLLWLIQLLNRLPWIADLGHRGQLLATLHPALAFVLVLIILEALVYALHRAFHAVPLLWRFHAVHHLDTEVDATTSHRHHTVEAASVSLLLVPIVALLGAPLLVVALVGLLRLGVVLWSHSNLAIPAQVDRALRWILVTPDFHRIHHSVDTRHSNSNFGTVLPWFDYLFGTARRVPYEQQTEMRLGLSVLREPSDSRLDRLLLLPLFWPKLRPPDDLGPESQASV